MKTCSKCRESKDESKFAPRKKGANGLNSWCKDCCRLYKRAQYLAQGCPNRVEETRKPKGIVLKARHRHNLIVKYGLSVVEALESSEETSDEFDEFSTTKARQENE